LEDEYRALWRNCWALLRIQGSFDGYTGLRCRDVDNRLLNCRDVVDIGLFGRDRGLFCGDAGLFCRNRDVNRALCCRDVDRALNGRDVVDIDVDIGLFGRDRGLFCGDTGLF